MAFMVVVSPPLPSRVNPGEKEEVFGPFVSRAEAEQWIAELDGRWATPYGGGAFVDKEFDFHFFELDDYIAFGEEVN